MKDSLKLDSLDRKILNELIKNAKVPLKTMAEKFNVATGTIHARIEKLKESKIILGSKVSINQVKLGFEITAFIGITLKSAKDYNAVLNHLNALDEVVEVHYTTGTYSIFAKIKLKSINNLHLFLIEKLQYLDEIQSTDTLISLDNPILREIVP